MGELLEKVRRGLRKPPRVIVARIVSESRAELERVRAPFRRRLKIDSLAVELGCSDGRELWQYLSERTYPTVTTFLDSSAYDQYCDRGRQRIISKAEDALEHRVDLLGSGPVMLGDTINWSQDFKSGYDWPNRYFRDIDYNNPERPSDVKVPWELSRLQWLIPVGQAYLLTRDERYAEAARSTIEQWIEHNPYAGSVNWACTMEVALRIITWTWFFHVFHDSGAWQDLQFQEAFLCTLYLHVEFTERHIERSDINGNHYTADAAGLVFGGLFFGRGNNAERWQHQGWSFLEEEIQNQVYEDGVNFEASVPYHRLVMELFLFPALYRIRQGFIVSDKYIEKITAMGRFVAAYSKPDGSVPYWGDADNARTLPFGGQSINDHRYLLGIAGVGLGVHELLDSFDGSFEEVFWFFGKEGCETLPNKKITVSSSAFHEGGFYIMRGGDNHIFIDCGSVGLAGRGGHGHNDCLSFEAYLDGQALVSDCGAYLYTASYKERNAFRSTAFHNTPQVDGEEINRFIRPDYLWNLHYDATPSLVTWYADHECVAFSGKHEGYARLPSAVTVQRTMLLSQAESALYIHDLFIGEGKHDVQIPLHLAPGVQVLTVEKDEIILQAGKKLFRVWWSSVSDYEVIVGDARVSPSYGVVLPSKRIAWQRRAKSLRPLTVFIAPEQSGRMFESQIPRLLSKMFQDRAS